MRISVGLLIMTRLNGELVAVLQRRGEFNHEIMGPESWPGACQITVHESLKGAESFEIGLNRGTYEEMGNETFLAVLKANTQLLSEVNLPDKQVKIFGVFLPPEFLKNVQLGPSSGGLRILQKSIQDFRLIPFLTPSLAYSARLSFFYYLN